MSTPDKKRGRGRPSTLDREKLLHDAMMLYWDNGAQKISINEICRRTGVSKPSLYRAFNSEDGLLDAVLAKYHSLVIAPAIEMLASDQPFSRTLENTLTWLTEPQQKPAGCLLAELRASRRTNGPATQARIDAMSEEQLQAFEGWFRLGLAQKEVNESVPPAIAARFIDAQLRMVMLQIVEGADPSTTRELARLAFQSLLRSQPAH